MSKEEKETKKKDQKGNSNDKLNLLLVHLKLWKKAETGKRRIILTVGFLCKIFYHEKLNKTVSPITQTMALVIL